jgi:diguanylate cyclase (GGDEF)-like protein
MFWLNALSNVVALLAGAVALVTVGATLRRHGAGLTWQGRVLPLVVLAAVALWAASPYAPGLLWHVTAILLVRLLFLAAAVMVWPLLREFAEHSSKLLQTQAQCRRDVASADATESRHWLRLAEKIARVGHWRYALADKSLTWSDEVFTIFGLDPDSCTPAPALFFSLIAPEDRDRAMADFTRAIESVSPFEFTVQTLPGALPGAYVTTRGIPEIDEAGNVIALFGVLVDITAQKRIEDDLKKANQVSEIANKALDTLARHDALTRLPNRRFFDEKMALEFKRAARELQPVGLIMIDLDYFKAYNDRYGHPAGDICLRQVAHAISSVPQRPADMVARYGGEEIVAMLPNTDLAGTETVADMIVQAVRALQLAHDGNPEGIVTVSCGAAVFEPARDPSSVLNLIERADQAMYAAKRSGRNRTASQAIAA